MRKADLFQALRRGLLGPDLDTGEVTGTEAIVDAAQTARLPIGWAAYALATAYHETGSRMAPNRENLNYSVDGLLATFGRHRISRAQAQAVGRAPGRPADQEAIGNILYGGRWGAENLGNTQPGDGWRFRGRGMDHVTGRRNYAAVDTDLGLGGALVADPDRLLSSEIAARCLVSGLVSGRYRRIALKDCLPAGRCSVNQFANARPIINPDANGLLVARHARQFQDALVIAGYA